MKLVLFRHPPVPEGRGRCYGRLELLPDPVDISDAVRSLAPYAEWPVFSSPAQRCRLVASRLPALVAFWPELQELDFGRWEGQRWDAVPRQELDAWAADPWDYRPGHGESASMLRQRWHAALARWRADGVQQAVVISHAGVIRMALAEAGLIPHEERWSAPIAHAVPIPLELGDEAGSHG